MSNDAQGNAAEPSDPDVIPEQERIEASGDKRETIIKLAQDQLQAGDYSTCLLTLSLLEQADASSHSQVPAMTAICNIHRFAALKQWSKVLSVPTDASEQDMKRQYRKLAAQVHPDKCDLPHSEEAFKLLGKAAAHVTAAADPSSAKPGEAGGDSEGPAAAWWEKWEDIQPTERKRKFPTSRPSAEDEQEDQALGDMSVKELQAEVRKRQSAVLRPEPGSEEEHMNAFQRQKRLRIARTVLGEKMQEANAGAGKGFY